jgi:hypothetical protein
MMNGEMIGIGTTAAAAAIDVTDGGRGIAFSNTITFSASKRFDNEKVGVVLRRQSKMSSAVVIGGILDDSIFSQYNKSLGGLEGAVVVSVNDVPVQNPRYATELLRCVMLL